MEVFSDVPPQLRSVIAAAPLQPKTNDPSVSKLSTARSRHCPASEQSQSPLQRSSSTAPSIREFAGHIHPGAGNKATPTQVVPSLPVHLLGKQGAIAPRAYSTWTSSPRSLLHLGLYISPLFRAPRLRNPRQQSVVAIVHKHPPGCVPAGRSVPRPSSGRKQIFAGKVACGGQQKCAGEGNTNGGDGAPSQTGRR